jgi:CRP/FNR family transcriptional regulator
MGIRTPIAPAHADNRQAVYEGLARSYPLLAEIDQPELRDIIARARHLQVPAKTLLMAEGQHCEAFALLLEGSVRVYQLSEDGREITLYRSFPGDICVMTLASLIHHRPFNAYAQTETPISALALSAADFERAMAVSETFRGWILGSLTNSFCDMMQTFHGTVFDTLEMRLACLLGQLFERSGGDTLQMTHQQLAQELGTTREVISRSLKRFERQGCIRLARGQIRMAPGQRLPIIPDPV